MTFHILDKVELAFLTYHWVGLNCRVAIAKPSLKGPKRNRVPKTSEIPKGQNLYLPSFSIEIDL